jgi:hypothetical protein
MKKLLAIFMALIVFSSFAFFAVGSGEDKKVIFKDDDKTTQETEIETQDTTHTTQPLNTEPVPETTYSTNPKIVSATTLKGTVLEESNVNTARSFGAKKTIDGYYDSCWCVNTSTTGGAGAQIRFNLSEKSRVNGFMMVNGNLFQPETEIFRSNGQVKNFTLTFSDGTSKSFTATYNEYASGEFEEFQFNSPVITDYIILTVNSGYVGQKFTENVAIGEVNVY